MHNTHSRETHPLHTRTRAYTLEHCVRSAHAEGETRHVHLINVNIIVLRTFCDNY